MVVQDAAAERGPWRRYGPREQQVLRGQAEPGASIP